MTLFVRGIGHAHPKNVITNAFLSGLGIGTDEEWILSRVGVRERRTILPLRHIQETRNLNVHETQGFVREGADNLVREAAKMALERANLRAEDVGLVISGGGTKRTPALLTPWKTGMRLPTRIGTSNDTEILSRRGLLRSSQSNSTMKPFETLW